MAAPHVGVGTLTFCGKTPPFSLSASPPWDPKCPTYLGQPPRSRMEVPPLKTPFLLPMVGVHPKPKLLLTKQTTRNSHACECKLLYSLSVSFSRTQMFICTRGNHQLRRSANCTFSEFCVSHGFGGELFCQLSGGLCSHHPSNELSDTIRRPS